MVAAPQAWCRDTGRHRTEGRRAPTCTGAGRADGRGRNDADFIQTHGLLRERAARQKGDRGNEAAAKRSHRMSRPAFEFLAAAEGQGPNPVRNREDRHNGSHGALIRETPEE
ncbi:importin subunit alpha-3 [Methylorubrum populi]|uniref:Importin subunit alpha-3 n=1 Tax=Methylorubrum populi TaxID=223967 RepID=A0A160PHT7_9HYPH|nr:importin subunit alpha-3 [Methylorubrum populi]